MGWQTFKVKDVCLVEKEKLGKDKLPYVGMEDIESGTGRFLGDPLPKSVASSTFKFSDKHVLYGRLRPYLNKVLVPNFEGHCSSEIFPLKPVHNLDRSFLAYWLRSERVVSAINRTCTGARMPRANVKELLEFDIDIPSFDEQKRIVAILDEAFADIDKARALTERNLENARELFESYLQQVFYVNRSSWPQRTLGESCHFSNGKAHEKSVSEDGHYIIVNSKFISSEGKVLKKTDRLLHPLKKGEIAMVMSDVPGGKALAKCFIVDSNHKYSLNQRICSISSESFDIEFLYFQLNRHPYLLAFDNKGSQANLRKSEILSCPLFVPDMSVQKCIAREITLLKSESESLEDAYFRKIEKLDALRTSLLQKAFNGELTKAA